MSVESGDNKVTEMKDWQYVFEPYMFTSLNNDGIEPIMTLRFDNSNV